MRCQAAPPAASSAVSSRRMLQWLQDNGQPNPDVTVQRVERNGIEVDITVASKALQAGDLVLRVPENLIVTLDRVFEDGAMAELLTTNKLSELACLTLFMAYEKKRGKDSFWSPFIQELDKQGGRGPQGAKTPLLWKPHQVRGINSCLSVKIRLATGDSGVGSKYECAPCLA